jgi:hypothetical protein
VGITAAKGAMTISISGFPASIYQVQASTNLFDWQSIGTITNVMGTMQFSDPAMSNFTRRFYRVVVP